MTTRNGEPPGDPSGAPWVLAVVGATGTGKSELGLRLAEELGGEVVNADAMQLYRGMDIGTAKLTRSERRGIPHHQLDVLGVADEASVAAYQRSARADIAAIRARGRHPVLVGGSGLYVRSALDHLEIPPTDPELRARLEERAHRLGAPALHAVLAARDPDAAARIEPGNTRRVVRALEVVELTGRPFSATLPHRRFVVPSILVGLALDRSLLDVRLDRRVRRMWASGLVAEAAALLPQGLREGRTASRAIGYAQALAELDGSMSADEAQEDTIRATRRFARRQESWFRPDPRTAWFDATADPTAAVLAHVRRALTENGRHD